MIRMLPRQLMLLAAVLLLPLALVHAATPRIPSPNVIIILTDDQGYGDLGCTGNPILKTPEMDRLHDESVRFSNFHVDSYCSPTRSALMTGRYSHRVGVWATIAGRNILRDDEVTMADVFRHNGYFTGHFGKWHLGTSFPYRPTDRGFTEWLGKGDGGTGCATDYWGNDRVNDYHIHNGEWEKQPRDGYEPDVLFDAAMKFIREHKSEPFFTYLALYNPHSPCSLPDPEMATPYLGNDRPSDFYATITHADQNLGRLRTFLKTEGLAENTVLIFLSDNGTAEGEKVFNAGMRGKKASPYDGGHRVPCFIHWPAGGLNKPVTVDRLATHLDLLPTLVDICSLKLPKPIHFDGTSLRPLLANPKAAWPERTIILGTVPNAGGIVNPGLPPYGQNCAVMTDRWRLVEDHELYDMAADPGQTNDVAARHPDVVKKLKADYQAYWADVSAKDAGWRGRPIVGVQAEPETVLCSEDWYPTKGECPWNQWRVSRGGALFGYWTVRFSEAGNYSIEVRRWPREADAAITGIPAEKKTVDAYLRGQPVNVTIYGDERTALPVGKIRLKAGSTTQEMAVKKTDPSAIFKAYLPAGPADIEATMMDEAGQSLCDAFFVYIRRDK